MGGVTSKADLLALSSSAIGQCIEELEMGSRQCYEDKGISGEIVLSIGSDCCLDHINAILDDIGVHNVVIRVKLKQMLYDVMYNIKCATAATATNSTTETIQHSSNGNNDNDLRCNVCYKVFKYAAKLANHMKLTCKRPAGRPRGSSGIGGGGGIKKQQQQQHGRYVYSDGSVYHGSYFLKKCAPSKNPDGIRAVRQGYGIHIRKDGMRTGQWHDDKMNGKGVIVKGNIVYKGDIKDDLYEGKGRLTTAKGDDYEGFFAASKKHGIGTYVYSSDDNNKRYKYVGEFVNDKMDGEGVLVNEQGQSIIGIFKGKVATYGMTDLPAPLKQYHGQFSDDYQAHGEGVLTLEDWSVIQGHFDKGTLISGEKVIGKLKYTGQLNSNYQQHGIGVVVSESGTIRGRFENDILTIGEIDMSPPLLKYTGGFNSDYRMHGDGMLTFRNGSVYTGDFVNGNINGTGRWKNANGDVYQGQWKANSPIGTGTIIYTSGLMKENVRVRISECAFKEGV